MEISEERVVAASPERVFAALNDAEILQKCIPGCESLEKTSDSEMRARVTIKIGPVSARFAGAAQISDVVAPERWTLRGEAAAGAAGIVKGEARVKLSPHPRGTLLQWTARAQLGGKIAQLGGRLVDGAAKKLAGQFFAALAECLESPADAAVPARPRARPSRLALAIALAFAIVAAVLYAFGD